MAIKGKRFVTVLFAEVKNIGPLHIGTGDNEILIDPTENKAILPATSIAGVFRSYVSEHDGVEKANEIFGSQERESQIYFYDSLSDQKNVERRPGVRIDPATGAAMKNHKLEREYLGANHQFLLKMEVYSENEDQKEKLTNLLYQCLNALDQQHINFGGHGTTGVGFFQLVKVEKEEFDLEDAHSLGNYLKREGVREEVTDLVKNISLPLDMMEIELDGHLTTPLLVKAPSTNNADLPDAENIRNSDGQYIIPGSSLKGVLRNQCQRILNYYKKPYVIEIAFGKDTKEYEERAKGRVFIDDSIVEQKGQNSGVYHRIKIDRFTSGVFGGALMTEEPILGSISLKVRYKLVHDPKIDHEVIAVLILALRDIGVGNVAIGSGNNVGRGRLQGNKMVIRDGKDTIVIQLDREERSEKLTQYIRALS
ncbi:RAMP superfamily CRISPR-associated protein [Tepidibacillus fermentans]|uniref:CRISPR/Cas system CSM-associated protein Csm3 (Group 7 of RAMP superfamily) n=1 Tax=Tepidibacillus fermentans TaxID=1281767 RepID=A0A4R3K826_9BACI|nr:RAMP superfamily CRISPR-associated protein [Tepidibacillus fermentans]TCS78933.1 CRISPR/Cas system CSM-associated protein Csm3 (group 7 of RAMP superfamily) [Tepidibacillus fermentans]